MADRIVTDYLGSIMQRWEREFRFYQKNGPLFSAAAAWAKERVAKGRTFSMHQFVADARDENFVMGFDVVPLEETPDGGETVKTYRIKADTGTWLMRYIAANVPGARELIRIRPAAFDDVAEISDYAEPLSPEKVSELYWRIEVKRLKATLEPTTA